MSFCTAIDGAAEALMFAAEAGLVFDATRTFPPATFTPMLRSLFVSLFSLALAGVTFAEAVKDREGAVRNDRANLEANPRWNYNDPEKAFAEAKRTGKPVLVVLRCVPCLACAGIDAQVLMDRSEVAPLL